MTPHVPTPPPQPPVEDLRNAAQIAQAQADAWQGQSTPTWAAFQRIADLLRHALAGLSEPNEAAIQATMPWLWAPDYATEEQRQRNRRDCAAAILKAQISGGPTIVEPQPGSRAIVEDPK